eukprot:6488992-Amphidinium_carterae.1
MPKVEESRGKSREAWRGRVARTKILAGKVEESRGKSGGGLLEQKSWRGKSRKVGESRGKSGKG